MMRTFNGAYRTTSHDGSEYWQLSNDNAQLLDSDDVIWVDDIYALNNELEVRYPTTDPRLSRLYVNDTGIKVASEPRAKTDNIDELAALAIKLGKVQSWNIQGYELKLARYRLLSQDLVVRNCELILDPKEAKKQRERIEAAKLKQFVTVSDLASCVYTFKNVMDEVGWASNVFTDMGQRRFVLNALNTVLVIFNLTFRKKYGKLAFKKFGPFQELVGKWKRESVESNKVYREAGFVEFADFMDKLAKGRLPKALQAKAWVVEKQLVFGEMF